jgi:2'-5' RNA ligase
MSYLASIIAELRRHRANVRWVPEHNIHVTLRFLGEITAAQIDTARTLMETAEAFQGFSLCASGLGAFPLLRAPRILWAGVDGESRADLDRLLHVQARTEQWARHIGLAAERRTYSPHVTLGRVARPLEGLKEVIDDLIGRECHSAFSRIDELVLMRSVFASGGVRYEEVGRRSLNSKV